MGYSAKKMIITIADGYGNVSKQSVPVCSYSKTVNTTLGDGQLIYLLKTEDFSATLKARPAQLFRGTLSRGN